MYELVTKADVLAELSSGSIMSVVDIPTQRVMSCSDLTLTALKSFIDKPETMFFKRIRNE